MKKKKIKISDPKSLHKKRQFLYDTTLNYRNSFLDKQKNRYKSKYLEKRNCPVCNSSKKKDIFFKEGSKFVSCKVCNMVYLDPVFKDNYLFKYYSNSPDVQANAHVKEKKFYNSIYNSGIDIIKKKKKIGKLMDLGCSGGFFLDIVKKKGWETFGIEINKKEFNIAKKKNHKVWNVELSKIDKKEKFDVITLWDVFEHIKDPHTILKEMKKRLNNKGLIFLQIPNSHSIAAQILREKCNVFDPIEHVNLYNVNSLKKLFSLTNFKVVNIKSVIDELSVVKNFLNYDDPYLGNFENSKKINFLDKKVIHDNFQGYKLQILISPK